MADRFWRGTTDSDPTDVNNWSDTDGGGTPASGVPGASDIAKFTGNGNNVCTMTTGWSLLGMNMVVGYTAKFDMATFTLTVGSSGMVMDGGGEFDCGSGVIALTGGPFDYKDQATWTGGTSDVQLSGTCTVTGHSSNPIQDVTLAASSAVTISASTNRLELYGTLVIGTSATLTLDADTKLSFDCIATIAANATVNGASEFQFNNPGSGEGLTSFASGATISAPVVLLHPVSGAVLATGGTFSGLVKLINTTGSGYVLELSAGTYNLNGGLELECTGAGSITLDNSVNGPTIITTDLTIDDQAGTVKIDDSGTGVDCTVTGNVSRTGAGTFTFIGGTLLYTLSGTANQTFDSGDNDFGTWQIDKQSAGTVTFTDATVELDQIQMVANLEGNSSTITSTSDFKTITGGNLDFNEAANNINLGSATWTVDGGDFTYANCGTWSAGTSDVVLKGTGDLIAKSAESLYDLTVFASAATTIPAGAGTYTSVTNSLTVNGTLSVVNAKEIQPTGACAVSVGASGQITGDGTLTWQLPTGAGGLSTFTAGAVIDIANVVIRRPLSANTWVAATWACATLFKIQNEGAGDQVWDPTGTHTFNCPVEFEVTGGGDLSIDGTNNPSYVFTDNVTWTETSGAITWDNAGTGTITYSGGNSQTVDLDDQTVEDIVVNKTAGNLILSAGVTTDSFTGTSTGTGDFDPAEQTIVTSGDCDWASPFLFDAAADCLDGCTWTIGGNFTADGQTLSATASWDLDVTGTAVASGRGDVAYSTAGVTEITASAGPWTDSGNNSGWSFSTATTSLDDTCMGLRLALGI